MTDQLRLYYAPDNASLCIRIALEELGVPYQTTLVDRRKTAQRSTEYLALNPNGLIPVLGTNHGPIFETAAILLWLSDRHKSLMPEPDGAARGVALQWLFWLSNTVHTSQRMLFYPHQYTTADPEEFRAKTRQRLTTQFDILAAAKTADWLDDHAPTVQGCYLAPLLRWCALYGGDTSWFDLDRWPRLLNFAKSAETRAASQRAAAAEGLGPTPFSAPQLPAPPEGSAT